MQLPRSGQRTDSWTTDAWAYLLIFFVGALVFSRSFGSELVFDSLVIIGDDPRLRELTAGNLGKIFTENYWWPTMRSNAYRPLSTLWFGFEYTVLGFRDKPMGYQLVNLILHCGAACVLFSLLRRLGLAVWAAFALALWFLVHPFGTEVVPNIVGLSDVLAFLSMAVAMLVYLRIIEQRLAPARGLVWIAVVGLAGILAKENAASFLALIVWHALTLGREQIVACWRSGYVRRRHLWGAGLVVVVTVAAVLVPKIVFREPTLVTDAIGADNPLRVLGGWDARLNALAITGQNLFGCLVPLDLSADYSFSQIPLAVFPLEGGEWRIAAWALGTLGFGLVGLALWRRCPALSFAIGAAFIVLLPTSNLLIRIGTIRGDRLIYPAIPAAVFCAGYVAYLVWRRLPEGDAAKRQGLVRIAQAGLGGAILVLGLFTHLRGAEWRTAEQFWTSTYATAPDSFKSMSGRAVMLSRKGELEAANEAVQLANQSLEVVESGRALGIGKSGRLISVRAGVFVERGKIFRDLGRLTEAAADFETAENAVTPLVEELAAANEKLKAHALEEGTDPSKASLDMMEPTLLVAELLRYRGKSREAADLLERYLDYNRLSPNYLRGIGRALVEAGDWERGLGFLLEASLLKATDTALSGESAWVWTHRKLPPTAAPLVSDEAKKNGPPMPVINLNDGALEALAEKAALRLSRALIERDLLIEQRLFVRQLRYKIGQPYWLSPR